MIQSGYYAVVYKDGQYRILRFASGKNNFADGKLIVRIKVGHHFIKCGFLSANNLVAFWRSFRATTDVIRIGRIQAAVNKVAADPKAAAMAYAMKENRCCRCGRQLTVPASVHAGMGPECAGKGNWTKADNQAAFNYRDQQIKSNSNDKWSWIHSVQP